MTTTPDHGPREIRVRHDDNGADLVCPYCGQAGQVVEHDRCDRHNPVYVATERVDGQDLVLVQVKQQQVDFHTVAWLCTSCGAEVSLGHLESNVSWW